MADGDEEEEEIYVRSPMPPVISWPVLAFAVCIAVHNLAEAFRCIGYIGSIMHKKHTHIIKYLNSDDVVYLSFEFIFPLQV